MDFVQEEETSSAQHRDTVAKEPGYLNHSSLVSQRLGGLGGTGLGSLLSDKKLDCLSTSSLGMDLLGPSSNGTGTLDVSIDEVGEDVVPYPRRINLIKQLAKSVIIGWDPPVVPPGWGSVSGYNVSVDKELRMSVPYGGRTKSLIEKLNLATNTYRVTVQTITDRGLSDELRCTMLVGKDVVVAPYYLRVDGITQGSAELSWMPSNSNYSHTIFLNGAEYDMVKAGGYRYKFLNLKPMTVYKVKVVALPHQVPWQLPMDQREKREISVEFCTQPAGQSPGRRGCRYRRLGEAKTCRGLLYRGRAFASRLARQVRLSSPVSVGLAVLAPCFGQTVSLAAIISVFLNQSAARKRCFFEIPTFA